MWIKHLSASFINVVAEQNSGSSPPHICMFKLTALPYLDFLFFKVSFLQSNSILLENIKPAKFSRKEPVKMFIPAQFLSLKDLRPAWPLLKIPQVINLLLMYKLPDVCRVLKKGMLCRSLWSPTPSHVWIISPSDKLGCHWGHSD